MLFRLEFPEHILSSLHIFITTYTISRMLNSIVMAQPLGAEQKTLRKTVSLKAFWGVVSGRGFRACRLRR